MGKKGIYITVGACILALAGAGVAAYNKTMDTISDTLSLAEPSSMSQSADNKLDNIIKSPDSSQSSAEQADKKKDSQPKDSSSKSDLDIKTQPSIMPVDGEVIQPFSNGELVKSKTLGVWKTHDGVDIKADAGTAVKAMNKGVVKKVYNDALWGSCVTIDHGNGIIGHYRGMAATVSVSEGDNVNSGDVIGSVGETAQIESALPAHLHFALERNGSWIDPVDFIDPSTK
ncbi:M23 family metallopeptidase [Ruminococcus sp. FC2018]|uniref:M23 family metallopeptidase n=1 Tax=Ruminococcus sp. FC2018 TaxID=1410617 RepID=UPI000A5DD867|nr:M23 family metallopeptidase [Ruminococcus sp. FC2018]